jgi:hypothetical protein
MTPASLLKGFALPKRADRRHGSEVHGSSFANTGEALPNFLSVQPSAKMGIPQTITKVHAKEIRSISILNPHGFHSQIDANQS